MFLSSNENDVKAHRQIVKDNLTNNNDVDKFNKLVDEMYDNAFRTFLKEVLNVDKI